MRRLGWTAVLLLTLASSAASAEEPDPLARARLLYNEGKWDAAMAAADLARANPARVDSADLIAGRAYLERYRANEAQNPGDLISARERLRRLNPQRFASRERLEFIVGLGETLYFEEAYGAAAEVFDSVLEPGGLAGAERDRVIDWWATSLDRDARPRTEFERQAVYQRIRERMHGELGVTPASAVAAYWLSAAARGQGDLQGAWDAAQSGWVRAGLTGDRGVALRMDLDRLVVDALIPERARAIGQPPAMLREEWDRFKERWTNETPP
jgi:hypothetical protein